METKKGSDLFGIPKSQSSQVEWYRSLPFFVLVRNVMHQIGAAAFQPPEMENVREIAMIIAEIFKIPPAAKVKIAGNNIDAGMVAEVFLQLTADHVRHVMENYRKAKYSITHTKTYLRTALYNSVFEINMKTENMVRVDMLGVFVDGRLGK